jgi:hypothetical protein
MPQQDNLSGERKNGRDFATFTSGFQALMSGGSGTQTLPGASGGNLPEQRARQSAFTGSAKRKLFKE